ncbi:MAG: exodeoxyribonuclease VII small subunit, partial [Nitrospirota bacterium]
MATVKFEEALARLEAIVNELERGQLPLDDSMRIFEEGMKLSKTCLKMLEDAERKVEILIKDKDGSKRARPFELELSSGSEPENGESEDLEAGSPPV